MDDSEDSDDVHSDSDRRDSDDSHSDSDRRAWETSRAQTRRGWRGSPCPILHVFISISFLRVPFHL